jgi:uncharacterized LabA/DUF88 family protein
LAVYVDAFNLYYGALKSGPYKWLNLLALAQNIDPSADIVRIHYFTARVRGRASDPSQPVRQRAYLDALSTIPMLTVHWGQYVEQKVYLPLVHPPASGPQMVQVWRSEEKGSDVNLATQLLVDAIDDVFDVAAVVSDDSDLVTAIATVQERFRKAVDHWSPRREAKRRDRARTSHMGQAARRSVPITERGLAASQFPPTVIDAAGRAITKPASW